MMTMQPQPTHTQPRSRPLPADPNDVVGRLNSVLANMSAPSQYATTSYQNPSHQNQLPRQNFGPSMESWQRDGLSTHESRQDKNKNDNVQEFKDLFATGMEKITQSSQRKPGAIDLTYNPGSLAPSAQPQRQLSLFEDNPPSNMNQGQNEEQKSNPFAVESKPEQFGQMQFHEPLPASEVDKAKANIDSILDGGMNFQASR